MNQADMHALEMAAGAEATTQFFDAMMGASHAHPGARVQSVHGPLGPVVPGGLSHVAGGAGAARGQGLSTGWAAAAATS